MFVVVAVTVLALRAPVSVVAASIDYGAVLAQQPDPKKKELTASLSRSVENETLTLSVYFPEDAPAIRIGLYNILGKLIEVYPASSATKGDQTYRFQTRGLASGPYIVVLEAGGQRVVNKAMLSR